MRRWQVAAALVAAALVLAGCGSSSGKSSASKSGTITVALDEDVAGFNLDFANDSEEVLAEIDDQIYPSPYIVQPNFTLKLDTDYFTSVKVTSSNPQTIVYNINPKAVWSDGTPITAADMIYNWQAQSGNPAYKDKGGAAFEPSSTAGYSQIKTITSSNGGKTATVVFSTPYADWKGLFSNLLPAHIAEKVGFNNGFQTFNSAVKVSGGPYEIKSYTKGEDLVEVPNPKWWGATPKLSQITYRFILDDSQQPPAVQNGEVQLVNPALASSSFYDSVKSISNFTTSIEAGLEYQHIDFNQSNPYLAKTAVRQAIVYGTNRQDMVNRLVGPLTKSIGVLNNRIFMPVQPQFQNTSASYGSFDPTKAKQLLEANGFTMGSDGYFQPTFGPEKGQDFTLTISTTSGVEERAELEQLFQSYMKNIGIKIDIKNYNANTLFGTVGPKGEFDIIEFAWVFGPFPSSTESVFCSYTNTANCGENWDHYANPTVDSLFDQAVSDLNPTTDAALYNKIDSILWQDAVTLPLYEEPTLTGYSDNYVNIIPNASSEGFPWNAQDWALKAS